LRRRRFGWPSDSSSQYSVALVDQAMVLTNGFVPIDQITALLNKDSQPFATSFFFFRHQLSLASPSSLVLNLRVSFVTVDRLTMPRWAIPSSRSTRFGWPTRRGLFFCTFSREFGRGLLLKWGFLIILHFHCLVPVLIFPLPLIQT
jgi:hypothetical protein